MVRIEKEDWNGFRICYINADNRFPLEDFKFFFKSLEEGKSNFWKCLGHRDQPQAAGPENTWLVPGRFDGDKSYIFKQMLKKKRWNVERAWRGLRSRGISLLRRIEKAREHGFFTPMRIYLFAERYDRGVVKERYMLAEVVEGVTVHENYRELKNDILKTVLEMHKFGFTWCGDPNPGNFLVMPNGRLRAIDLGFSSASWINQGKDLYCLEKLLGISDGKFRLKTLVAKIQSFIKNGAG